MATLTYRQTVADMSALERWTMDFMHDTLGTGRTVRVLAILDA
jgi:hypothetical protein